MTVLFDSSAWLAHLFGEPGVEEVNRIFDDLNNDVLISALSIPEIYGRLKSLGIESKWDEVWATYSPLFSKVLPVNEKVAHQAVTLRDVATKRLPTIDSLIAATAAVHGLTLVHRDPHFAAIPATHLQQLRLQEK